MQPLIDHARPSGRLTAVRPADHARLAEGRSPQAPFITSSGIRVVPALLTGARPGESSKPRTAQNAAGPHERGPAPEAATIDYAVSLPGVTDAVICGPSPRGDIGAPVHGNRPTAAPVVRQGPARSRGPEAHTGTAPAYRPGTDSFAAL
jgi:carbonic anhydrase